MALNDTVVIEGEIELISVIDGELDLNSFIDGEFGAQFVNYDGPFYTGETVVTPMPWSKQILLTNGQRMIDDVTVLKIPYKEVTNFYGGLTVNIGEIQ